MIETNEPDIYDAVAEFRANHDEYAEFLKRKTQLAGEFGFEPNWIPEQSFGFQKALIEWACRKGRGGIFASCGMGKSLMELVWGKNVARHSNGKVLILTPLAVAPQFIEEGEKFGVECGVSRDGKAKHEITIANYERLHYFNPDDFQAVIADESGCLKNFDSVTKAAVTEFMRRHRYRLLATATPAPNDFIELGTSSECLGEMGYMDMLGRFFKNDQNSSHPNRRWAGCGWRFRGHAEKDFWRWVCSWARAIQKPSDLGFDDKDFILPKLETNLNVVSAKVRPDGWLFDRPAINFQEEREERRRTIKERCEKAAELISARSDQSIAWCDLNDEGDLLEKIIPNSAQVKGSDDTEEKEEILNAFREGKIQRLVTKGEIAGFGLNFQNCCHQTYFPSHSYERWHQCVRRSWRFGQKNKVVIDVVMSEGQRRVMANLQRKTEAAELMFERLVGVMNDELKISRKIRTETKITKPTWN